MIFRRSCKWRIERALMFGQEFSGPIDLLYGLPPEQKAQECPIPSTEWVRSAISEASKVESKHLGGALNRHSHTMIEKQKYQSGVTTCRLLIQKLV